MQSSYYYNGGGGGGNGYYQPQVSTIPQSQYGSYTQPVNYREDSVRPTAPPLLPHNLNTLSNANIIQQDTQIQGNHASSDYAESIHTEKAINMLRYLDRNGITEFDFVNTFMRILPFKATEKIAKMVFKTLDTDKNGRIELNRAFQGVRLVYQRITGPLRHVDHVAKKI